MSDILVVTEIGEVAIENISGPTVDLLSDESTVEIIDLESAVQIQNVVGPTVELSAVPDSTIILNSEPVTISIESTGSPGPAGPQGTNIHTRSIQTITTSVLGVGESESGTVVLSPSYNILRIQTNVPARIRLYYSLSSMVADESRPIGIYPSGDHGVVLDFETDDDLDWSLIPAVLGYVETVGDEVPWTITNLHTAPTSITVNFLWLQIESNGDT